MAKLRNVPWGKWLLFFSITCSVLAHRKLDVPGYTRQFIYQINTDCQDFKPVRTRCPVWKDMGFCFKYRREMQHVCNRTCQYCVPGQKQWKVINMKGAWGQVQDPTSARAPPTTPSRPTVQQERPLAQILGKERPLQTDSAAEAIANELDRNDQKPHASVTTQASPHILGRLPTYIINSQSSTTQNTSVTQNKQQGGQQAGWKPKPSAPAQPETTTQGSPTAYAQPASQNVSGTNTQVGESGNERHPVVVLMGYELGEKSSEKVHNVLKTSELDNSQQRVSGMNLDRPETNKLAATNNENRESMSNQKSNSHAKESTQDSVPVDKIPTDQSHKNVSNIAGQGGGTLKEGAALDELAELLDREAAVKQHLNVKNIVHAGSSTFNNSTPEESYLQHVINGSMGGRDSKTRGPAADVILPISTDLKSSISAVVPSDLHGDTRSVNSSSMKDTNTVELNGPQGVKMDSIKIEAGNKHGSINDPNLQVRTPFQKPGKQVTLTINERPGTGEAVFQVQNSPHGTGLAYAAGGLPAGMPPQNFLLANENEEARAKAEEEEKRIQEATHSIKNVLRLFNEGHRFSQNKLLQEQAQDFPANSKSLDTAPDLAGIQNAIDAQDPTQDQTQDHPGIKAQAIAKQIGQLLGSSSTTTGPLQPFEEPNYAFISASDSQDWKSLARTLATQLKHVLNHMEDRERENSYEKEKLREQMMFLTQQQMTGRDDDEDPDEDEDYDDDRFKKNRFVLTAGRRKNSKKPTKSAHINSHETFSLKTNRRKKPVHRSVHQDAVKTLSRLKKTKKVHRHPC